jgi:nucleoside-diphosphate-sugar epimerase
MWMFTMWLHGLDIPELARYVREEMDSYSFDMWARAGREIYSAYAKEGSPLKALAALKPTLPVLHLYAQPDDPGYTILKPNNFFQNDYWFKEAILQHSVYPQPIGDIGLFRIDVRDIAEVAAVALTTKKTDGEIINLSGPDALTGKSTADIWTRVLGRPVSYGGNDLDTWEQQTLEYLPPWMTFDFKLMYAFFQENGLKAAPKEMERQRELQGREPKRYEDFVEETSKMWKER